MWKTGYTNGSAKMRELGAPLAGELSGHVLADIEYHTFDDGIFAGCYLLKALEHSGQTLEQALAPYPALPSLPEDRLPFDEATKFQAIDYVRDTFAPNNLLSRGQEIAVEVDEARGVDILLRAGEMSLHHVRMVHGSPANRSDDRRVGFAIRYVPTYVRQIAGDGDSAMLVRGVDEHHHFAPEYPPASDLAPEARAHHAAVVAQSAKILYRGTGVERFR